MNYPVLRKSAITSCSNISGLLTSIGQETNKDIAKMSMRLSKYIFFPSLPLASSLILSAIVGLNDTLLAGRMGTKTLAAMSFCEPLWFMMTLLVVGLCSGITVAISSRIDSNRQDLQSFIVDALIVSTSLGLVLCVCGIALALYLNSHPHMLSGTAPLVASYFQWCAFSNLSFTLMQAQCAIFRAGERSRFVLYLWGFAVSIEIMYSNCVIHFCASHNLAPPGLEVFALGWILGCTIAAVVGFSLLKPMFTEWDTAIYCGQSLCNRVSAVREILVVGGPVAAGELGVVCSGLVNLQMLASLPDANTFEAVWAIKTRVEDTILVVPLCAIGMTITAFIARYSNHQPSKRTRWAASVVLQASCVLVITVSLVAALFPLISPAVAEIFLLPHESRISAIRILSLASLSWPFFALCTVCCAAMEGTGNALRPASLSLFFTLPVRLSMMWTVTHLHLLGGADVVTVSSAACYGMLALTLTRLIKNEPKLSRAQKTY